MSVPSYSELGKAYRDFFSYGYYFGILQLSTNNRTCREREIKTVGIHTMETGDTSFELETRKTYKNYYDISYVSKWNTDGLISTNIFYPLHHIPGLTIGLGGHYNFESKDKLGKLLVKYKHENATLDLGLEGGEKDPILVNSSLALGYNNFLLGYQIAYDADDGQITKNNMALGYTACDFTIHGAIDNFQNYCVGVHHKTTDKLETGAEISYISGDETPTKMSVGLAYRLNPFTALRAKVNTTGEVGLGYEVRIKDGATVTFGTLLDGKKLNEGGHNIGIGLEFEQ